MKRILLIALMVMGCMVLTTGYALAIGGACVNCHTMHNSQNGSTMQFDTNVTTPQAMLLRGSCLGCHAQTTTSTIISGVPQVMPSGGNMLAGGTFYNGQQGVNYAMAHNPYGASATVFILDGSLNAPPGDTSSSFNGGVNVTDTNLSCAGTTGCHGNRTIAGTGNAGSDMTALQGAHHGNNGTVGEISATATPKALTVGTSFRFLNGIYGYEETNWENAASATVHNQYYASNDSVDTHTISYLCSECHGGFHGDNIAAAGDETRNASSEWIRHPTDHIIPASKEYVSAFNSGAANGYDYLTPVGSSNVTAIKNAATPGTDMVICLSCHRAHGSQYADMLRWNYDDIQANTTGASAGTACFRCHTQKDGV